MVVEAGKGGWDLANPGEKQIFEKWVGQHCQNTDGMILPCGKIC